MQTKSALLDKIESGKMSLGDKVLSENRLAESFGVSRMTARRALTELVTEGILARSQGVGTFAAKHKNRMISKINIFYADPQCFTYPQSTTV